MQRLQNCIGPTIRIGREILCLPYAGFFKDKYCATKKITHLKNNNKNTLRHNNC